MFYSAPKICARGFKFPTQLYEPQNCVATVLHFDASAAQNDCNSFYTTEKFSSFDDKFIAMLPDEMRAN
jgi:hypothetical protein